MRFNSYSCMILFLSALVIKLNCTAKFTLDRKQRIPVSVSVAAPALILSNNNVKTGQKHFTSFNSYGKDSWTVPVGGKEHRGAQNNYFQGKWKSLNENQFPNRIKFPGGKKGKTVLTKATKAGLFLTSTFLGKLIGKLLNFIFITYPTWLTVPPLIAATLLGGIILGRLAQIRLTPVVVTTTPTTTTTVATTTTTPTTTTPTTTTPTTTTTTTTTVAPPGGSGTANFFFGTNLSGPGAALTAPIGTCVDVPAPADNMFSSIDTLGNCVIVCDLAGCTGACYMFTNAGVINDLGSFNLMTSSIQFC